MRSMTVGIEPIVWTAATLLVLAVLAFVAELLPPFLLHESRSVPVPADHSIVANGRVFCRVQRADIDVDECVGCPHLRVMDGRGTFVVCDGRAAAAIAFDR
jgi:hypothetical protein